MAKQRPCRPQDPHPCHPTEKGDEPGEDRGVRCWVEPRLEEEEEEKAAWLFPTLPPPCWRSSEGGGGACTSQLTFLGCLILVKPWTDAAPSHPLPAFISLNTWTHEK